MESEGGLAIAQPALSENEKVTIALDIMPSPGIRSKRPDGPTIDEGDPFSPHKILNYFDRIQAMAAGELVYPVTVEIDPSNKCNHRCPWCVSAQSHTGESLEFDRFCRLLDELKEREVKSVVLKGGGEPTVHPRINDMLHACEERGLATGLITNGSMPRTGTPQAVLDTTEWVRISLDAARPATHHRIHGTCDFARILRNIQYLTANTQKTLVGLNFVADQRNHTEIAAFARLAKALGTAYVSIRCVFDPTDPPAREVRDEMRSQAVMARQLDGDGFKVMLGNFTEQYLNASPDQPFPYRRCLGPNLVGIVGADGEVYACCFLRGYQQFSFGNLAEQSFEQIWSGERRRQAMEQIYRGGCGHVCMGGMTSSRYNVYNEMLNYLTLDDKRHAEFI